MNTLAEARPEQARPGQPGPGQARAGQAQSGQARSGQARSASARPGQAPGRLAPSALALLESARQGLANAEGETSAGGRYVAAHLAALRAAAAIVAARPAPGTGRRKAPRSVWELLPKVEPALAEWAAFFAAGAGKRAAAEAGLLRAVSSCEADDLLRDAETFLSLAEEALGRPAQAALPLRSVG
jgi:HEPN superfamily protein